MKAKKNSLRLGAAAVTAGAAMFAFPAFAFAAEGESGGISAILPNMTEFIPMLIAFIIVAIILWKLGWPMFEKMLAKRETTIKEALEKSEAAREESEDTGLTEAAASHTDEHIGKGGELFRGSCERSCAREGLNAAEIHESRARLSPF